MSSYTALPLGGNPSLDNFDTAYHSRRESMGDGPHSRSHSRSHSQARTPNDWSDDIALIDREKHPQPADLYDPHTRTGRPSISHHNSQPEIQVSPPANGLHPLTLSENASKGFTSDHSAPISTRLRSGPPPPSGFAKFLARIRFLLYVLTLGGALLVVGTNAQIYVVYAKYKGAMHWSTVVGEAAQKPWEAWPKEGIDMKPVSVYTGVAAFNSLVFVGFVLASAKGGFRYLKGLFARIVVCILTFLLVAAWVVVTVLFCFQEKSNSGKHSFRTWSCTHQDQSLWGAGFSWRQMCINANISRYTGMVLVILNLVILLTALLSCCTGRKGYEQIGGGGVEMTKEQKSVERKKRVKKGLFLGVLRAMGLRV